MEISRSMWLMLRAVELALIEMQGLEGLSDESRSLCILDHIKVKKTGFVTDYSHSQVFGFQVNAPKSQRGKVDAIIFRNGEGGTWGYGILKFDLEGGKRGGEQRSNRWRFYIKGNPSDIKVVPE